MGEYSYSLLSICFSDPHGAAGSTGLHEGVYPFVRRFVAEYRAMAMGFSRTLTRPALLINHDEGVLHSFDHSLRGRLPHDPPAALSLPVVEWRENG
jgi:hypothetical protein